MSSRNAVTTQLVQNAVDAINSPILESGDFDMKSEDTYQAFEPLVRLIIGVQEACEHAPTATAANHFADMLRKLLPLAESIAAAQSKLKDGTLLDFLNHSPFRINAVLAGLRKLNQLMSASEICLRAATTTLEYFTENRIHFVSKTGLAKEELEKITRVVDFPIEFFTLANTDAFFSKILKPNGNADPDNPVLRPCAIDFSCMLHTCPFPLVFAATLNTLYNELPQVRGVKELRNLSRPKLLSDECVSKALIKYAALATAAIENPLCHMSDLHVNRYFACVMRLEGHPAISNSFWAAQAKDDMFTAPFLKYLVRWKEIRDNPQSMNKGVEMNVPILCIAVMRVLGMTVFNQHKNMVRSLSSKKAINTMHKVGLEMLEFSKNSLVSEQERIDLCIAATALLGFRVFMLANNHAQYAAAATMPAPEAMLESLSALSQGWVECAYCFVATKSIPGQDFRDVLVSLACSSLMEVHEVLEWYYNQLRPISPMPETTLIAIFKAQEAISTILAISGWIFSTYSHEVDFITSKKALCDLMPAAISVNTLLYSITNRNVSMYRYPKSAELCEAGLKAVEAASKALLWGWKVPPQQMLELAQRHPDPRLENFSIEVLHALASGVHRTVKEIVKAAVMCSPFYGYSATPGDSSSELARKVGATSLKAFHALETKPHPDWVGSLGLDLSYAMCQTYLSMPGLLQDPNPAMPYQRKNSVFLTAIAPILASPEPWLENAVDVNNRGRLLGLKALTPQANSYFDLAKQTLQDAMKDVVSGGAVERKRAIARAKAMATLQCGYVGCRTVMLPEQKSKLCGACCKMKYCSEGCLKADWKKNHKLACKAIAAADKK